MSTHPLRNHPLRNIVPYIGAGVVALTSACGGSSRPEPTTPVRLSHVQVQRVPVNDQVFAPMVKTLLLDPTPTDTRLNTLAGVIRHQLLRADSYYDSGHEAAGLAAVTGALLLARAGEFRPEMFEGAAGALLSSARLVARLGDEGRAEAFYQLALGELTAAQRADAETHLKALHAWQTDTRAAGSMEAAYAAQLAATKRAVVQRTPQTLEVAQRSVIRWIERAIEAAQIDGPPRSQLAREELREAHRGVTQGAQTLAALYLRDGDAAAAAAAIDEQPVSAVTDEKFGASLDAAANGNPDAWAYLLAHYESSANLRRGLDPALARSAAWGAAVALLQTEPTQIRSAVPISTLLVEYGMADVAPLIVRDALGKQPDPRHLSWALRLTFQALITAERHGDIALVRQVYDNSQTVLSLAGSDAYLGRVRPAASDFSYLMGAVESRAGDLSRARAHLETAIKSNPSTDAFRLLAAIDRQQGQPQRALESIRSISALARSQRDLSGEAESQLAAYEVLSELDRTADAGQALAAALSLTLKARNAARNGTELAVSERILADILELYGDRRGATRATTRAHDAARNNLRQLTATLLDAARRALVTRDLASGRLTLRRALDADLQPQDLVYVALWVQLLHERLRQASDGTIEEAFARIERDQSWVSSLRDWAQGGISDSQLLGRAQTEVERVEAQFYGGTRAHFRGASQKTRSSLQEVARSPAIELIEVRIARELLVPAQRAPEIPTGVSLP